MAARKASRFAVLAVIAFLATGFGASADKLERYSPEDLWLSQAVSAMIGFLNMLEPIYEVTSTMVEEPSNNQTYRDNGTYAIDSARTRLNIIHENAVWMIDVLPEKPPAPGQTGARLIGLVGDLKARAEDIRLMCDAVLLNFEAALAGDDDAMDQGVLEAAALLDALRQMHDVIAEIEMASQSDGHPIMNSATRVDKATLAAIIEVRKLEFLLNLPKGSPEFGHSLKALGGFLKEMRSGSEEVVRHAKAYKKTLAGRGEYASKFEADLIESYLETEGVRMDLVNALESVVYQLSREDLDADDLIRSLNEVYRLVPLLSPENRQLEEWKEEQGRGSENSTPIRPPREKANL